MDQKNAISIRPMHVVVKVLQLAVFFTIPRSYTSVHSIDGAVQLDVLMGLYMAVACAGTDIPKMLSLD